MTPISRLLLVPVSLAWLLSTGSSLQAASPETAVLDKSTAILNELGARRVQQHLANLLQSAQGVAIFPRVIKAGALVGGRHGHGVLLVREADGSWGPPVFLTLSGISAGNQAGIEGTDLVLIFRTRSSLDGIQKGKLTWSAGASLAVCSAGIENTIGADACLKTRTLSTSHSRGLFAGVFLEGTRLRIDQQAMAAYQQGEQSSSQNAGPARPELSPSLRLQMKLAELSAPVPNVAGPSPAAAPVPSQQQSPDR